MEVEIISREEIKPASPTPHHSRFYKISILDQLAAHVYTNPLVFFFPNDHSSTFADNTTVSQRRQRLKQSLAEALVTFFPLAGKIKDDLVIECNDDGVYYAEARVNWQLHDFLMQPTNQDMNRLLPFHPASAELFSKTDLVMIRVSIFNCGGIAIGLYASHKIVDGLSILTFMQAWAATARQSLEQYTNIPSFISVSAILPCSPRLSRDLSLLELVRTPTRTDPLEEPSRVITRRYVFDRSALAALKTKAATPSFPHPSSATVVMGLLWKCAIAASIARWGFQKRSVMSLAVSLRTQSSVPLPPHSFGNIYWLACAECMADSDHHLDLQQILRKIRRSVTRINSDFVQGMKGENRIFKLTEHLKELEDVYSDSNAEYFAMSSLCKGGLYEVDFGWGRPIWTCIGSSGTDAYGLGNLMVLMDTRSGDGIEAWVTMKEVAMTFFEKNPELIAFASLDPSPLEINNNGIHACL